MSELVRFKRTGKPALEAPARQEREVSLIITGPFSCDAGEYHGGGEWSVHIPRGLQGHVISVSQADRVIQDVIVKMNSIHHKDAPLCPFKPVYDLIMVTTSQEEGDDYRTLRTRLTGGGPASPTSLAL